MFVAVQNELLSAAQVENGNAQHAIKAAIHLVNIRFEFLPENFLLGGSCLGQANAHQQKQDEKTFQESVPPETKHYVMLSD